MPSDGLANTLPAAASTHFVLSSYSYLGADEPRRTTREQKCSTFLVLTVFYGRYC